MLECYGIYIFYLKELTAKFRTIIQLEILQGLESASFDENADTELVLGTTCGK